MQTSKFLKACLYETDICYESGEFVANILLQNVQHSTEAKMTGFIVTCEDRAFINGTCNDPSMYNVSDFKWPDLPNVSQVITFKNQGWMKTEGK